MQRTFPLEHLIIRGGQLSFRHHCWAIQLELEPFDLPSSFGDYFDEDYKSIATSFDMDLLEHTPKSLAGSIHTFPKPSESFDASIYIVHAHHPVDIVHLDATKLTDTLSGPVQLGIKLFVDLEYEGLQYDEKSSYKSFVVNYELQLTPQDNGWSIGPTTPLTVSDS